MKEKNLRLADEVNKLIANILSSTGGVYLPQVGSFTIDEAGRSLLFTTKRQSRSVVVEIAERGGCSEKQASQVYEKWLALVKEGDKVTIAGIGVVEGEQFAVDPAMAAKLNPQPIKQPQKRESEEPKERSKGRLLWIAAVVVVVAIAIVSLAKSGDEQEAVVIEEPVEVIEPIVEVVEEQPIVVEESEQPARKVTKLRSRARYAPREQVMTALEQALAVSQEPMRYRVVCGVLHSSVNAGRLILDVKYRTAKDPIECRVYRYGESYMVTLFESDSFLECRNFLRERGAAMYDSVWICDRDK